MNLRLNLAPLGFRPADLDRGLLWPLGLLMALGLVMVASSSVAVAERYTGESFHFLYKQLVFMGIGLAAAGLLLSIPLAIWERSSFVLLAAALLVLAVVLFPGIGHEVNGARRWLNLGFVQLQASEPARLALFMYLSAYAVRRASELRSSWTGLAKPLLPLGAAVMLLLLEPDFGASAVLMAVSFMMLFMAGARLRDLAVVGVLALGAFGALMVAAPYRVERLLTFRDPWAHAFDGGFQLTQSLIAIGRGEWFGVGLGNSVQKLLYLPETHTDFIFAIFAEEFGLLGVVGLLVLLGLILRASMRIASAAAEQGLLFGSYLAYAIGFWMVLQALLNIGVNMGVLPTKGLPLPFVSYGGSSMVMSCAAMGLMLRVALETARKEAGR
ncbi:MAG: putative lipid II flippase FtsW [Oceanococcus sp.]|nr:MAG: putative lipid II flippase FtsW [Oceanococcus sp.]